MSGKIGIGYVTYKRQDNWKKLILKQEWASEFVVCNDGTPYPEGTYPNFCHVIQHEKNISVGKSKNDCLRYLMEKDVEHFFLIEDDIIVKDPTCFQKYIDLSKISGVKHLNFAYHGPANLKNGKPNPRFGVEYDEHNKMAINFHCVGAFSYYHRSALETAGLIDEVFINAWEHVEHTYRIIKHKMHPAFWNFADVWESNRFFEEIGTVNTTSVIRKDNFHQNNIQLGMKYFQAKHGIAILSIPDMPKNLVYEFLEKLQNGNLF